MDSPKGCYVAEQPVALEPLMKLVVLLRLRLTPSSWRSYILPADDSVPRWATAALPVLPLCYIPVYTLPHKFELAPNIVYLRDAAGLNPLSLYVRLLDSRADSDAVMNPI